MIPKAVSAENTVFIVFSAKHSFAEIKECNLKKKTNLPKIGGCLPTCKKVFFCLCFCCLVVLFFFACIIFFDLEKKKPNVLFLFFSFFVPKRLVFKILLFFLFYFLFWFSFCHPFQNSIFFFDICPSTPFWKTLIFCFFNLSFACLFPFLMFACFFQTNFPHIPFLKPKLLSFLVVYLFLQLFLFLFSCFMFLPFCFDVGFVFGMSYFVLILFLFCFLFCFHIL